ncbi:hypothetical protein ACGF07_32100 [Kitasatospora sp. NPDC048194]|uniref:hypothetical protein n=1 Tax=Kitasatospora sp. NPDC048194 TaxID=3364045 RepID=UPI00371FEC19
MNTLTRWAGAVTVAGGGIALAGASGLDHVAAGWWILWATCAAITAGAYVVRHRAERRG